MKNISLLGFATMTIALQALAIAPRCSTDNNSIHIENINSDNPLIYDNDWWFDVFDKNYLFAQASLGNANLRGLIVSRDMWDWQKGYLYRFEQCWEDAQKAINLARQAGLKNIPDPVRGSDRVLMRPDSGRIEDTKPHSSPGSNLIISEARKASSRKPLIIVCGGPLTTVANALLIAPEIASNIIVFNLTVNGGYNGKDAWSVYIVTRRAPYVDWGGGEFWDKDSVFTIDDFKSLPDNPFTLEMKRLIATPLGRANQLGDGAPLLWLWQPSCWRAAAPYKSIWRNNVVQFEPTASEKEADLLVIPKSATDLKSCRQEFFRVLNNPALFKQPPHPDAQKR